MNMKNQYTLKQWLEEEKGRVKWLAEQLETHYSWVSQIARGYKKAPLATAIKISKLTNYAVSPEMINSAYKSKKDLSLQSLKKEHEMNETDMEKAFEEDL